MATLYVENVPDDLYAALKDQAKAKRSSVAAEVLSLLQRTVPTRKHLEQRRKFLQKALKMSAAKTVSKGPFQSAEQILREDRAR